MRKIYQVATSLSWDALVFFLPVTSLPLLSRLMGGTDVAPFSVVFLAVLVLFWFIPRLIKNRSIPYQSVPLFIFFLLAVLSSLLAFFRLVPTFKGEGIGQNELSSLITLAIGLCFFLITSLWISDEQKLKRFLVIVNISGGIALLYSLIQAVFIIGFQKQPSALANFQNLISASQTLFAGRVNGLTLEPSWLAHQLNMFYIPIWIGLSLKKVTLHKLRIARVTIENLLVAASLLVLFLTKSRIGWLVFLFYGAYLFLRLMNVQRMRILTRISISKGKQKSTPIHQRIFNIGFWLVLGFILLGVLVLAGWVMTKVDPRMADFFDLQRLEEQGVLGWAANLLFAERIVYWITGFSVFLKYPIFGVGLGNSGYFIPNLIGSFGYSSPEILSIFVKDLFLPNPKNLWVRILAETGLAGFSVFIGWLWVEWKNARAIEGFTKPLAQAIGISGQVVLVGLILEGFSVDTFALPYYWMTLGLVVAVFRIYARKQPVILENLVP